MNRSLAVTAALLGATGVVAGAFAAHGLRGMVSANDLAIWQTGARYQLFHAVALLAIALSSNTRLLRPGVLMAVGTLIFAGSLYVLVLTGLRYLGAITPIGGTALVAAWLWLGWHFWRDDAQ